jgi:hypothetical protein
MVLNSYPIHTHRKGTAFLAPDIDPISFKDRLLAAAQKAEGAGLEGNAQYLFSMVRSLERNRKENWARAAGVAAQVLNRPPEFFRCQCGGEINGAFPAQDAYCAQCVQCGVWVRGPRPDGRGGLDHHCLCVQCAQKAAEAFSLEDFFALLNAAGREPRKETSEDG